MRTHSSPLFFRTLSIGLCTVLAAVVAPRLNAAPVAVEDYAARAWRNLPDDGIEYDFAFRIRGDADLPMRLVISGEGTKFFTVDVRSSLDLPAGQEVVLLVKARLHGLRAKALDPFTPDTCVLVFKEAGVPAPWSATFQLRLGTALPLTPPGKEFLAMLRGRVERETWAKTAASFAANQADKALAELGSPIEPPTEGSWLPNEIHMWHWPKYIKLVTGSDGRKTCPECRRSWTPEQVRTGSTRCDLYRSSLSNLGLAAMATGSERYARAACEMLKGLARIYGTLPVGPQGTRLGLNYMIESRFDREALWCIRRLRTAGMLSDADLKEIATGYLVPSLETVIAAGAGTPNIMMLRACAVGQAGLVLNWPPYVAWALRDEAKGMVHFTRKLIGEDGGWREGSLSYHMTTHLFITPLPAELKLYGYDVMQEKEFGERLRKFYRFPMLAMRPDKRLVAINDAGLGSPAIASNAAAYWLTREPCLIPWLNKDLEFAVDDAPPAPKEVIKSRNFPDFGIALLHDGGAAGRENWVLLRYGEHGGGHGHFDKLNVVAYVHGQPIHDDLGSVYSDPRHFGWLKNTVSHNTLNVDEEGQQPTKGRLDFLSISENGPQVAVASTDEAFKGVHLERAVLLVQGAQVLVDRAVSNREHVYDWIFTCYGQVSGTSAPAREISPLPGRALTPEDVADNPYRAPLGKGVGYEIPRQLREMSVSGNWWLDWENIRAPYAAPTSKSISMRWMAWSSGPARVVWGDSPGLNLKPDQHRWVMARQTTNEAAWVTALVPRSDPPLVEEIEVVQPTEGSGLGVHLKAGRGGAWIAVNWRPGQPLKAGPITTSERVFVQP